MGHAARLFVISGPAGVGKGTMVAQVRAARPRIGLTVSATTRTPRPGEVDGTSYYFLTDEDFDARVANGEFLEWAQVHDHRYGTLKSEVEACLSRGNSVILEIDVQGGASVHATFPGAVRVFIKPPSWDVLVERLRGRGTESEESLELRLKTAKRELELAHTYDECIVNDDLQTATNELMHIIDKYEKA